jgi:hypothetical protein
VHLHLGLLLTWGAAAWLGEAGRPLRACSSTRATHADAFSAGRVSTVHTHCLQDGRSFNDAAESDDDAEASKGNRGSCRASKMQRGGVDVAGPDNGKNKKRKLKQREGEEARRAKADLDMILMDDGALLAARDGLRGNLLRQGLHLPLCCHPWLRHARVCSSNAAAPPLSSNSGWRWCHTCGPVEHWWQCLGSECGGMMVTWPPKT